MTKGNKEFDLEYRFIDLSADALISENDIIGKIIDGKIIKPVSEDEFHLLDHKIMEMYPQYTKNSVAFVSKNI